MAPLIRLSPNLRVMTSQSSDLPLYFAGYALNKTPNLVSVHMKHIGTSFYFHFSSNMLPSLRHLAIDITGKYHDLKQEEIHTFLKYIGVQLHTFQIRHSIYPFTLDSSLWNILPNVESIQLPFQWAPSDVPKNHPLKRVQVAASEIPYEFDGSEAEWNTALSLHCPLSFQRKLSYAMDRAWRYQLFENPSFSICIWSHFEEKDAHLEDAHGDTLFQYIVFLIKAFWKQPHRSYRRIRAHN